MYYINKSEPISLEYIAGNLARCGFDCNITTIEDEYCLIVEDTGLCPTKIFMFSAYTYNYDRLRDICRKLKTNANHKIVLGGYHPSGLIDPKQNCCDYIVKGEGEEVAVLLAKAFLRHETVIINDKNCNKSNLPPIINSSLIDDLNKLPFPLRDPSRLNRYVQTDLSWPPVSQRHNASVVLFSRGCRYNCEFCASQVIWGNGVRYRSPDNIVAELYYLKEEFNTNYVVVLDQAFGQNREWTIDVCHAIAKANLGISWYNQSHLNIDIDMLELFAHAGCKKIGFGLELLSPNLVGKVKSSNPTDIESINRTLDVCTSNGIFTKAYIMIGFPWEDEDIITEYMDNVQKISASEIKIMYVTPFPGTIYWEKYKNQLITREWKYFDTVSMPVIHNPNISVMRYREIREDLFHIFYGSNIYAETTRNLIRCFSHYAQSCREFCLYLKSNNMITGRESWLELIGYYDEWSNVAKEGLACKS